MSFTLDEQINQLKRTIAEMEAQRVVLGDAAVEAALVSIRQKLSYLEEQVESSREGPQAQDDMFDHSPKHQSCDRAK